MEDEGRNLVRVMSREEKMDYEDITIEETIDEEPKDHSRRPHAFNEAYEDNSGRQQDFRRNFRSYGGSGSRIYSFNLGRSISTGTKWKYRIIGGVIVLAVAAFLLFVALPVVAVGIAAAMIVYLLLSFFS